MLQLGTERREPQQKGDNLVAIRHAREMHQRPSIRVVIAIQMHVTTSHDAVKKTHLAVACRHSRLVEGLQKMGVVKVQKHNFLNDTKR